MKTFLEKEQEEELENKKYAMTLKVFRSSKPFLVNGDNGVQPFTGVEFRYNLFGVLQCKETGHWKDAHQYDVEAIENGWWKTYRRPTKKEVATAKQAWYEKQMREEAEFNQTVSSLDTLIQAYQYSITLPGDKELIEGMRNILSTLIRVKEYLTKGPQHE